MKSATTVAVRATVHGAVQGVGFRDAAVTKAHKLGVTGWVRNGEDQTVLVHAEGPRPAVEEFLAFLHDGPPPAHVDEVTIEELAVGGHEQFAIRGVSAGVFVIEEHTARTRNFQLRLEVDGVMRSWALPKGPSLDPAVKRLAVEGIDSAAAAIENTSSAGAAREATGSAAAAIEVTNGAAAHETPDEPRGATDPRTLWDTGTYEQGGRVPWPEALTRGHAVFVLHGEKLRGGFALQRTRREGAKAQWLLIKRRDEYARPGSDILAEHPAQSHE